MAKRVAVTGATGLIGSALVQALNARGDEVVRLVRHPPQSPHDVPWDPAAGTHGELGYLDALVNLAGAPIGRRWTYAYKEELLTSRLAATRLAATITADLQGRCALINGSATGFYGADRGDERLDETSPPGTTFLAEVVQAWEAATTLAQSAGVRVALARTGIVLAPNGGALAPVLRLTRLGLGGPLGSGRQFWPWISLEDEVAALIALIDSDLEGPVNLVAPTPARQGELARQLGAALHRPALLPAPSAALRLVMGEFAADILGSQQVVPQVLSDAGFTWSHPDLSSAVTWLVGAQRPGRI